MICDSTPEQKNLFLNALKLARSLGVHDREIILLVVEGAHIPPPFRYCLRDGNGALSVASDPEGFVSAVFNIVRDAVAFGVPTTGSRAFEHPTRFSAFEVASYIEHKPRPLSRGLVETLAAKSPDRLHALGAATFVDSFDAYLRLAKKNWPLEWSEVEFSDFAAIRPSVPAPIDQRMALICRLAEMRLAGIPGAVATIESAGVNICDMDETTLLSSMDASIVALTEQFFQFTETIGATRAAAIHALHAMRSDAHRRVHGPELPPIDTAVPLSLAHYTNFYLRCAHSHGVEIDYRMVPVAIRMICGFYGRLSATCFCEDADQCHRN